MNILRIQSVLHYHYRTGRKGFLLMVLLLSALLVINLVIPLLIPSASYDFMSYSDGGAFTVYLMVILFIAAHSDTRFLTSKTLPRVSIWIGQIGYMLTLCVLFALVRTLLSLFAYGAASLLSTQLPTRYSIVTEGYAAFQRVFRPQQALATFWDALTGLTLWGIFTYCYACWLRRWKALTISLTIAVPVLIVVTIVLPFWYEALHLYDQIATDSSAAMRIIVTNLQSWIDFLESVANFIENYWRVLIWGAAAVALPLSWVVMRRTRQPSA